MLFFSLESSAKDCSAGTLSILKRDKTQISSCHLLKGLQGDKKVEHVLIVRTELIGKAARGVGIEIYKKDSLKKKPIFEDFGLGQLVSSFFLENKKSTFLIKDFNSDGIPEFGVNVLNERTTLFFIYRFDKKTATFLPITFSSKMKKETKILDRLVSTIDHPVKINSTSIQVFYKKNKFVTYQFKDGSFLLD